MARSRIADAALASAARAGAWIVERQRPDGGFFDADAGIGGYYKLPYALLSLGYPARAARLLDWVSAHHFTGAGDFRAAARKARGPAHDLWPVYGNAWLVLGAHRLGWFDLSFRGASFILGQQVPAGGFPAVAEGGRFLECVCTSWGGLAVLAVGHVEAARGAGQCLVRLVEQQPEPGRFWYRMTTEGKLLTAAPAGEERAWCVDAATPQQIYYQPGIALIFLCRLYLATGESPWRSAAERIFEFSRRCAADVYRFPPSGKLGVGCALLARITGRADAADAAWSTVDYLIETQRPEGCWALPDVEAYRLVPDKNDPEVTMDLTAEFAAFLVEIAALDPGEVR